MADQPVPDRRERYRDQTRQEAKRIALDQLANAGVEGISVNAIAKRMGLTGPALYRYFASRDDLLTELIRDAYTELAVRLEAFADSPSRRAPEARIRELADGFREWALTQPHRYLLLFGTPVPGYQAPPDTTEAANRAMWAIGRVLAVLPAAEPTRPTTLDRQLAGWMRSRGGPELPPGLVARSLRFWTRLHGVISLEVAGQFTLMGFDPALLYRAEVDALLAEF